MNKFELLDKVRAKEGGGYYCNYDRTIEHMIREGFPSEEYSVGNGIIINMIFSKTNNMYFYQVGTEGNNWVSENGIELVGEESNNKLSTKLSINSKKSIMKNINNYIKKILDTDTQALVKAGYLNGDLEPTEKAVLAVREINFFLMKEELVKRAKEEIAQEEKTNK